MAIASFKPTTDFKPDLKLPEAQPNNYKGLTYDNNQTPVVSLLAYIDGAPWSVDYFTQILGEHNDLKELDTELSPQYQSYQKIVGMELRVQNELESSTDGTQQITSTTGSALVYSFLEPNVNDYFIAQTSYNRYSLFRVTSVDRHTWRRESVHTIQYHLVDYTERLPKEIANLKLKTTTEYFFSKERLMEGLTPYLKTDQYEMLADLRDSRERIGNYYLDTFINNSCKTLIIPGQGPTRIYDMYLVDFVLSTFGFIEFPKCYQITQYPKTGDVYIEQPQFWSAILNCDRNLIDYGNKQMTLADTSAFTRNSYVKTLFSTRADMIVYPWRPDTSTISGDDLPPVPTFRGCIKPTTSANGRDPSPSELIMMVNGKPVKAYPDAHVNGYYVLSSNFYENKDNNLTLLEIMTRDYLHRRTLDLRQLTFLIDLYPKMPRLEQFYFGPLLLALMKYADRQSY